MALIPQGRLGKHLVRGLLAGGLFLLLGSCVGTSGSREDTSTTTVSTPPTTATVVDSNEEGTSEEEPAPVSEENSAGADEPLPEPTPFPVTEEGVRLAMERWFAAYNVRAENAFLAMVSDKEFSYTDCDYEKGTPFILRGREAVREWVRERWNRYDDRFFVYAVSTSRTGLDWEEGDPKPVLEVSGFRSNTQLSEGIEASIVIKISVPIVDGRSLLNVAGMEGRGDCMSGSFEGRYFPIHEHDSD